MDPKLERLKQRFFQIFGDQGRHVAVTRAPGKVNLLGDHTDYNDGYGLAVNFPLDVTVIGQRRADGMLGMYSCDAEERIQVPIHNLRYVAGDGWANYPKGVVWALENLGQKFEGFNLLIEGRVPQGAGLASSTALAAACALAASSVEGFQVEVPDLARALRSAENQFMNVHSGILDPLCILTAGQGNALFMDARTLECEEIPLALDGAMVVVLDSGVARSLKIGDYAKRQEECREALKLLKTRNESYQSLRDLKVLAFERHRKVLPPVLAARAEHVVYENDRVLRASEALKGGDAVALGELMNKSHRSLSRLMRCSTEEMDALVGLAQADSACFGARLTGGGFGGCAVALVKEEGLDEFLERVKRSYWQKVGGKMKSWVLDLVGPASEVED
ncbi:MAG: galactokinase [bacterium]